MDLIDALKRFNRKERFHLLHHVLGYEGWSFRLSEEFRKDLCSNIGERVPPGALVMMDYHLDWISMAVWLSGRHELPTRQTPALNEERVVGNQEDIDLLVAFRSSGNGAHRADRSQGRHVLEQLAAGVEGVAPARDVW